MATGPTQEQRIAYDKELAQKRVLSLYRLTSDCTAINPKIKGDKHNFKAGDFVEGILFEQNDLPKTMRMQTSILVEGGHIIPLSILKFEAVSKNKKTNSKYLIVGVAILAGLLMCLKFSK